MSLRSQLYDWLRRNTSAQARGWFKRQKWFMPLTQVLFSTDVYSKSYFEDVERLEKASIIHIASWIKDNINPKTIIDIGCGPGHMMEAFHRLGIRVYGIDISDSALRRVRERGLKADKFDLTDATSLVPGIPYDLVVSCEVAEHLKEKYALLFVQRLCQTSDKIYLTAAEPDTAIGPGMMHYNEQPNKYWIELFQQEGFLFEEEITACAREFFEKQNVISYLAKPMIFRRDVNE